MSNSCVLTFNVSARAPCIYLHWNGDCTSVRGFLLAADELGLQLPDDMGWLEGQAWLMDQLADMIASRFFGNAVGRHVYRCEYADADCDRDNGVFILDLALRIVGRRFQRYPDDLDDAKTIGIAQTILKHEAAA